MNRNVAAAAFLDNGIFITLLNPAITLTLAAAFLVLWVSRRPRPHLLLIALAYTGSAMGFLLLSFTLPIGLPATKLLANISFAASVLSLTGAIFIYYGRRMPWLKTGLLTLAGLTAFCWFLFVQPDLTMRVLAMNLSFGGICIVVATELRTMPGKSTLDRVLLAFAILAGLNFIVRPVVSIWLFGPLTYESLDRSLYWTTALFSHAVLSLMIALCLFTAEALDMMKELRSESLTDPLSGLLNRRGFELKALKLLEACKTTGLPVSLVIADLDHFKSLNDRHGHAAGDTVIVEFANRLRDAAGMRAIAARIGGEEFAVLLPMADLAAARLFAEAVRAVFAGNTIRGLPEELRVTGSFGIASYREEESLHELVRRADDALYQAKRAGRDGVYLSGQPMSESPPGAHMQVA